MLARSVNLVLLGTALTAVQAQWAGNAAAVTACKGFPIGALKCLTDVSFVICNGGYEVEQFVAAGTHCEQGIPYEKLDAANVAGVATLTRIFTQNGPDPSSRFGTQAAATPAASDPAVGASSDPAAAASSPAASSDPASSAAAASTPAASPAATTPATANTIVPLSTTGGTFATASSVAA